MGEQSSEWVAMVMRIDDGCDGGDGDKLILTALTTSAADAGASLFFA